ncbi:phosphatidylinositol-glycan biosynthesis class W protein-like [Uloborus diversus]|uniref:phosphatidylinositol-glycan biosynthesis class W protein-like n=1 Tax=Uloborus diversus TaxID=327109 RepID=UPI0024092121|nr:phosphatidylinositol-glycan biosynthesis class W protein-like [Uloborus diversus]
MVLIPIRPGVLSMITMVLHQWLLLKGGLTSFVLSDDRRNLFEENKEGICSLLGFMSLYLYGIELGSLLWKTRHKTGEYLRLLWQLCGVGFCGWIIMYALHASVQPISRRMANLSYCVWVVSLTTLQIAVHFFENIFLLFSSKFLKHKFNDCLLWKAINFNALFYFLLANVITGVVNLSIHTFKASNLVSLIVLVLYLTVLSLSTVVFFQHSIRFKFW